MIKFHATTIELTFRGQDLRYALVTINGISSDLFAAILSCPNMDGGIAGSLTLLL